MFNFTSEEKKVILFLLGLGFCGLILNSLIKFNCGIERLVYPQIKLAKINLNKVKIQELANIKCIPLKLAQRIIDYRLIRKEFSNLEELKEVQGIGQKRYEKLKEIFFIE